MSNLNESSDLSLDLLTGQGNGQTRVRKKLGTIAMMQDALDYPRLSFDCDSGAAHVGHLPRNSVF